MPLTDPFSLRVDERLLRLASVFFAIVAVWLIIGACAALTWQFCTAVVGGAGGLALTRLLAHAFKCWRADLASLVSWLVLLGIWGAGVKLKMGGIVTTWLARVVLLDWMVEWLMRVARKWLSPP